jgi:hypothetical protein
MFSNSKLTKTQKAYLKEMAVLNPQIAFTIMGNTTIAFQVVGNLIEFATAICSDTEKKNRPNVGKYLALTRLEAGETVKLIPYQFDNMLDSNESPAIW